MRYAAHVTLTEDDSGLLVKPDAARRQIDLEAAPRVGEAGPETPYGQAPTPAIVHPPEPLRSTAPKRYHGTVVLDSTRVGRDAGRIADEVITHLVGLVGSSVRVTLEIEAEIPEGAPDNVVRTVTENARTLKFSNSGFETE